MFDDSSYISETEAATESQSEAPAPTPLRRFVIAIHKMHEMHDPVAGIVAYATHQDSALNYVATMLRVGGRVLLEGGRIFELPPGKYSIVRTSWSVLTKRGQPDHDNPWFDVSQFKSGAQPATWPKLQGPLDPDFPPPDFLQRSAPETIARLYAGRQYEDVRLKPATRPPKWCPHRYDLVSGCGSSLGD